MLRIEPFDIYSVVTGTFRLDGGAMFGVVPKVLWGDVTEADELNRIPLTTRTLVAVDRSAGRVVLADTGCGTKWAPEQAQRYAIRHRGRAIADHLAGIGLSADDVTDVVVTHLHFDHNGGLTEWAGEPGGPTRLCFPKARHWIHRRHWEHAQAPHVKEKPSFLRVDFEALGQGDHLSFVEGENPNPPFEGMEWFVSHGHTSFHLHPLFGVGASRLLFVGDMVPTMAHLRLGWVMAYDVLPMTTIEEKQRVYRNCFDHGWQLAFPHDPAVAGVAIGPPLERPAVSRKLDL